MCTLFFLIGNLSGLCVAYAWLGWRPRQRVVGTPSASHNTGSLPLCRSCIKLYACCQAGDVMQACASHQTYASQQQAGA